MPPQSTSQLVAVYHSTDVMAMLAPDPQDWLQDRAQHYRHVATVNAPLECIFEYTNHSEESAWITRPEVVWVVPGVRLRSTSVGDVFVDEASGCAYLVAPQGLQEIASSTA